MSFSDFEESAKAAKIATAAFANIEQGMKKLTDTQLAVTQSSRALTQLMAAKSLAEGSDTTQEIVELQVQMTALQRDITELTTRLQTLRYQPTLVRRRTWMPMATRSHNSAPACSLVPIIPRAPYPKLPPPSRVLPNQLGLR